MKLFFFWTVTLLIVTNGSLHAWPDPTKGGSGVNLSGKMFTLSRYNGGLVFYSPYYPPPWASPTPYQTRGYTSDYYYTSTPSYTQSNTGTTERSAPSTATGSYTTPKPTTKPTTEPATELTTEPATEPTTKPTPKPTTRSTTYLSWTTGPSTRGVSVCLRYITDSPDGSIFSLSPSRYRQLKLNFNGLSSYTMAVDYSNQVYLQPNIRLWSGLRLNMWTSICLTVDTMKGVAQMFRDSDMSARKLLMFQYEWPAEPAIDFSRFEGQLTDVQMWDYPLSYKEVLYYMSSGYYGPYQGSVLNWSYISYSLTGKTLLEDSYEKQLRQPTFKRGRGRHLKGKEKPKKLLHMEESKDNRSYLKK